MFVNLVTQHSVYNSYGLKNKSKSNNNLNFGYRIAMDIGASTAAISAKLDIFNKGVRINHISTKLAPNGVQDESDFILKITEFVKSFTKENSTSISKLPKANQELEGLDIFIAGRPFKINDTFEIEKIRNIKSTKTGKSLQHVNFGLLNGAFPNSEIHVFNDMIGACCSVLNRINPEELNGSTMVITTGGGFGVGHIQKLPRGFMVTESRDGRRLIHNEFALEDYGASVKALIRNFLGYLKFPQERIEELVAIGDARIATNSSPEIAKQFGIPHSNEAMKFALGRYIEALSKGIELRYKDKKDLQQVFLSGKVVSGLNEFIKGESSQFEAGDLCSLIRLSLKNNLPEDSKLPTIKIIEGIEDNTEGGRYLENKSISTIPNYERNKPVMAVKIAG